MSRKSKSVNTETKLVVTLGWKLGGAQGEMGNGSHGYWVSLWDDKNVLNLLVVTVAQCFEYTKTH